MKVYGLIFFALLVAQSKPDIQPPDLSGLWRYSNDKMERGPQAVILVITQDGPELKVRERLEFEAGSRLSEFTIFTDGRTAETRSTEEKPRQDATARPEMRPKILTTKAKWKGGRLHVDTKVFYTPQDSHYITEVWTLASDRKTLTIKKTFTTGSSIFGEVQMVLARVADAGSSPELKSRKAPGSQP